MVALLELKGQFEANILQMLQRAIPQHARPRSNDKLPVLFTNSMYTVLLCGVMED